jgi:hypothetical protein
MTYSTSAESPKTPVYASALGNGSYVLEVGSSRAVLSEEQAKSVAKELGWESKPQTLDGYFSVHTDGEGGIVLAQGGVPRVKPDAATVENLADFFRRRNFASVDFTVGRSSDGKVGLSRDGKFFGVLSKETAEAIASLATEDRKAVDRDVVVSSATSGIWFDQDDDAILVPFENIPSLIANLAERYAAHIKES